jgi:hypothetical protein
MRDTQWISREAELWWQFMDSRNYWVKKPGAYELRQLSPKKRQKRIDRYHREVAEKFAAGWRNYSEWMRH